MSVVSPWVLPSVPSLLLTAVRSTAAGGGAGPSWTDRTTAIAACITAAAAVATALVAAVAARFAWRQVLGVRDQLEEARTLRREQAQPYVVVYAEVDPVNSHAVDVVIRNLGATGARDVKIASSPPLMRSRHDGQTEVVELPSELPFLAPGQQWRTLWNFTPERTQSPDLQDRYEVAATYTDSFAEEHRTPSVLDWNVFRRRRWLGQKTVHDAAQSLEAISKTLQEWAGSDEVVRVATYDGPAYDEQLAREAAEQESRTAALLQGYRQRHPELADRLFPEDTEQEQA